MPDPDAGAFPFWRRGDERANSIVRLQQIFPRILAAEYDPPEASPPCLHLLRSLLCSDPTQRADINAIMTHPWCAAASIREHPGCAAEASCCTTTARLPGHPSYPVDGTRRCPSCTECYETQGCLTTLALLYRHPVAGHTCAACASRQCYWPPWARMRANPLSITQHRRQSRRFQQDLPPGLHEMNDHLLHAAFPPEVQPVQEIMQILQARHAAPHHQSLLTAMCAV